MAGGGVSWKDHHGFHSQRDPDRGAGREGLGCRPRRRGDPHAAGPGLRHRHPPRGRRANRDVRLQIFADGARRARVIWVADLLPNEIAGTIAGMIEQGLQTMKKTLST
jgi:hypothetical protein